MKLAVLRSAIICLRVCRDSKRLTEIDSSCSAIVQEEKLDSKQFNLNNAALKEL